MSEALRPLTVTEILDRTAQMYRSRFLVFLGIATIPAGTMFVFMAAIVALFAWIGANSHGGGGTAYVLAWTWGIILSLLVVPANLGASALGEAAMSDAAARYFLGHPIAIRAAYKTAWRQGWRYVGLFVLEGLAIIGGPAVIFVAAVATMIGMQVSGYATNDRSPVFGGMLFLLLIVVGVLALIMLLRICLAFPASVVEEAGAWTALKRATRLSEGTRWRILLVYVLGWFLNQIVTWVLALPGVIVIALIPSLQGPAHAQVLGQITIFLIYGAMFAVRALTKPVYGIALTLFYFDARIRKEGFDIEWMMQQAGLAYTPTTAATQETAPVPVAAVGPVEEAALAVAVETSMTAPVEAADASEPITGEGSLATASAEEKA